tara:strand:+ start:98235 stop:98771 length:537 start_codon:yes stop_codon:yes gene_type:complete
MNIILNRLRGEKAWVAIVVACIWAGLTVAITGNLYIAIAVGIGYGLGEAPGWGEWIGGLIRQDGMFDPNDIEGEKYGIYQLASLIADRGTVLYDIIALMLRGLLWWVPALLPFAWLVDGMTVFFAILFLAVSFPMSVLIGRECRFTFPLVTTPWKRAEVIYGGAQDLVLIGLLLSVAF